MDDDGEFPFVRTRHICITIEWQFDGKHCTSATDTNAIWCKLYKLSSVLVIIKFEYFPLSTVPVLHSRCRGSVFIFPFVTWSWSAINVVCMADVCVSMHFGLSEISWCRILENCFRVTTISKSSTIENTYEFATT